MTERNRLLLGGGLAALMVGALAPGLSWAQSATDVPKSATQSATSVEEVGEVVVTGSRVVTNGYRAPTPVTVLSAEQLRETAPSITEALRQLPQLAASSGPSTLNVSVGANASTNDSANLRSLGAARTLVLIDGRRPMVSGATGTANMALFPLQLVKRVDIVTGGASATYGSDAVAGVVNFVLDTDLEGMIAEARGGISSRGDAGSYGFQLSGGVKFGGGRGSAVFNVNATQQDELASEGRPWTGRFYGAVPNPNAAVAGQPALLLRENVNLSGASNGGLIISPGVLQNIQFDATGNPVPYRHGDPNSGTIEVGGDGSHYEPGLLAYQQNVNGFFHTKYQLTDDVSVFAEGAYGVTKTAYDNLYNFNLATGAYTIRSDNAYLPASIATIMRTNGIASFRLGKIDVNEGRNRIENQAHSLSATLGFEAKLPANWSADGYYMHGESLVYYGANNSRLAALTPLATDAVINPADGQIVCRSTLTSPSNGCVPLNPFGTQPLSDAQRAYLFRDARSRSLTIQDVAGASAHGQFLSTWAGPVTAAVGVEYRRLASRVSVDPISAVNGYSLGGPSAAQGSYDVSEVFGEVLVPLARDLPLLRHLELNAAARRTDYSISGGVTTWKLGLTNEVTEDLRIRGTYSQDIRAPNINELFAGVSRTAFTVRDPVLGGRQVNTVPTTLGSNPGLVPERARTITLGAVYRPSKVANLGFSVDYYRLEIKDAIATLAPQTIIDECFRGNAALCAGVTRDASQNLTSISAVAMNVAVSKIAGVDFEANYAMDVADGHLSLRGILTYLDTYKLITPGAPVIEQAGVSSRPQYRGNLQTAYRRGPLSLSVQERVIGAADRVLPPATIDDNSLPITFYTDFTVRYRLNDIGSAEPEVFVTVNNLFDQAPRTGATNSCSAGLCNIANPGYDSVGRYFTFGARARF